MASSSIGVLDRYLAGIPSPLAQCLNVLVRCANFERVFFQCIKPNVVIINRCTILVMVEYNCIRGNHECGRGGWGVYPLLLTGPN